MCLIHSLTCNRNCIHSDSVCPEFLKKWRGVRHFMGKSTSILNTISDFIHANILIEGNSSISKVCVFLGDKKLVITHDDSDKSCPESNYYRISDYLSRK